MSAFNMFAGRFSRTTWAVAIALVMLIVVFVPSALAHRQIGPYLASSSDWVSIGAKQSETLIWQCPSDRYAVSGGFETEAVSGNPSAGFKVIHSYPEDSRTWHLRLRNSDDIARNVKIYAVCVQF